MIKTCWQHHVVSWHQGDSWLQEAQAALGAGGVDVHTDLRVTLLPDRQVSCGEVSEVEGWQ